MGATDANSDAKKTGDHRRLLLKPLRDCGRNTYSGKGRDQRGGGKIRHLGGCELKEIRRQIEVESLSSGR